uniref:Fibronectin type-III domain-containing protein n=1 Tax=Plectus sambesii TaxID=2011161 RepID=A0A914UPF6_9BILA
VTVTPPTTAAACQDLSLPQTEYEVLFKRRDSEKTKHVTSFENTIQINEDVLDLDTDYEVAVTWRNRFSQPKDLSRTKPLTTGFGYPSAPKSAQAYSLSPDTILVFWSLPDQPNAPLDELRYRITVQSSTQAAAAAGGIAYADGKFAAASSPNVTCLVDKCQAKIPDLKRSTEYKIWITALHKDSVDLMNIDGRSNETSAKTLDVPGSLTAEKLSGAELMLKWTTLNKDNALKQINVEYKVSGVPDGTWQTAPNGTFDPKLQSEVEMKLSNLRSATTYDYRYNAIYENELKNDDTSYSISQVYNKAPLQMRTIAGIPSAPQNVRSYADAEGWLVKWQAPANDGGESILSFVIDYRPNASAEWQTVEESVPGSQLIWRPQNLHPDKDKSEFRVAAVNSIGVGAYGSSKDMPEIEGNGDGSNMGLVVAAAVLILLLVAALCVGAFIWHWRRNKKRMSKAQAVFTLTPIRPGIGGGNHNSPAHMPAELVEELKSLPHVPKSCVNLVRILGKGSFGEVFEGLACNLPRIGPKSLRVAVKVRATVLHA